MSNARHISLGDDFGNVVITANHATVEILSDGNVVTDSPVKRVSQPTPPVRKSTLPPVPAYSESHIPVDLSRLEKAPPGSALRQLIDSATATAKKFGHAEVTFLHVTAAALENSPDMAEFLEPKMKVDSLKRMVQTELGKKPKTAIAGQPVKLGNTTAIALAKADWITGNAYKSDRLLPLEAFRSMMVTGTVPVEERAATIDYAKMIFNAHFTLNVAHETREAIGRIAVAQGQLKDAPPPAPGIQPS